MRSQSSPISPSNAYAVPPGFLKSKRKKIPISELGLRELKDKHAGNLRTLSQISASTSSHIQLVQDEQNAIEARLVELQGIHTLQRQLQGTTLSNASSTDDSLMDIDSTIPLPPHLQPVNLSDEPMQTDSLPQAIGTKRRILDNFNEVPLGRKSTATLSFQEAVDIQQRVTMQEMERRQKAEERRMKHSMPGKDEVLTRAEREQRIWAFMNYKPTDSDLEDEDEEDDDDDDPSTWFDDDQDDGIKGQDIVAPDENLDNVIRVFDPNKYTSYNAFYEPPESRD